MTDGQLQGSAEPYLFEHRSSIEALNPEVQVETFDAQNLTNEKLKYFVGTPDVPRAIYDNGRTFYAGVRFKF